MHSRALLTFLILLIGLTAGIFGQVPTIIRTESYIYTTDKNKFVKKYEIFQAADGIIDRIKVTFEYSPYTVSDVKLTKPNDKIVWSYVRPNGITENYQITKKKQNFILAQKRVYAPPNNQLENFTKTIRLVMKENILWEDEERKATLIDGVYEEIAKQADSKYKYAPDYYKIKDDYIYMYFKGHINNRYTISKQGNIYMAQNGQEMYEDNVWDDVGWSTMENWQTLRSSDPMVNAINFYILGTVVVTPIYMPVILGLPTGQN